MGRTSNHKPQAINDTDHRQQATENQTANMCGGGGNTYAGLAKAQSACFKHYLDKTLEKVDTLGLNLICPRTIVRVLLFKYSVVKIIFVELIVVD